MTGSSQSVMGSKGLRVEGAASHRGCRGCAVTRHRGEWTRECPTRGKVLCEVREVFSTGFGSEASELGFARKCWSRSKALDVVVRPLHEPSLVRLREGRSMREVSKSIFELTKIQRSNYRLNTRARMQGSESGSKGEPCTVRRDYG